MTAFRAHIIHVGNMNNKGTQALFHSDVSVINDITNGDVFISVSTTDIEGVRRLNLPLNAVLPPVVDIPYERADQLARKLRYGRGNIKYKVFTLEMLLYMFVQVLLSVFSILFIKLGLRAFYRAEVIEHIKDCDLVISHSDESFKETASLLPLNFYWVITWWSMLIARTWEILVAKSFNKPVVMFPNSVGPFRTWIGQFLSRLSLGNCDYVLIRDPVSYKIADKLGIRSCKILTFDTALLFSSPHKIILDDLPQPVIAVSPGVYSHSLSNEEICNYIQAHAKSLDAAIKKYGFSIVLLPHYISGFQYDDLQVCELILHNMENRSRVKIVRTSNVAEFKLYLDQMDMIVSSKMHPAVLGASGFVPILCIAYDHKQTGFFERLGAADCTIDIRQLTYEKCLARIDYVWTRNDQLRALLKDRIPAWQKDVKGAIGKAITPYIERKQLPVRSIAL